MKPDKFRISVPIVSYRRASPFDEKTRPLASATVNLMEAQIYRDPDVSRELGTPVPRIRIRLGSRS